MSISSRPSFSPRSDSTAFHTFDFSDMPPLESVPEFLFDGTPFGIAPSKPIERDVIDLIDDEDEDVPIYMPSLPSEDALHRCTLSDPQKVHIAKLQMALNRYYPAVMDRSKMGAGKTRSAQALAICMNLPIFVIRPATVNAWEEESIITGVKIVESIAWSSLASRRGTAEPKHGWLIREDVKIIRDDPDNIQTKCQFYVTEKFKALVASGVLLVADESQNGKNDSAKSAAFGALATYITASNTKSKVILLSGSAFDKPEHSVKVCQTLGLLDNDLRNADKAFINSKLLVVCKAIDPSFEYTGGYIFKRKNLDAIVYKLFIDYISTGLSSSLPVPKLTINLNGAVGFYKMEDADISKLEEAMEKLQAGIRAQQMRKNSGNMEAQVMIGAALQLAHSAKIDMAARRAKLWLEASPKFRVLIFGAYHESLNGINHALENYDPLLLTGKVGDKKQRDAIITKFQTGENRVLISNLTIGGVGLNLQDKRGGQDTLVLILPNHNAQDQLQAMYRCYRQGAKSDVTIRLLFSKDVKIEKTLLDNLMKKSKVWQDLMQTQVSEGERFLDLDHVEEADYDLEVPRLKEPIEEKPQKLNKQTKRGKKASPLSLYSKNKRKSDDDNSNSSDLNYSSESGMDSDSSSGSKKRRY